MARELLLRIQIPRPVARLGLIALLLSFLRGDLGLATQHTATITTYLPNDNARFLSLTATGGKAVAFAKKSGNITMTKDPCTGFVRDDGIGAVPRYKVSPSGDCNKGGEFENQVLVRSNFVMPVKPGAGTDTLGSTRYAKLYVNGDIKADRLCWKDLPPDSTPNCIYDWPPEIACLLTVKKCVKTEGACKTTPQSCRTYINRQIEVNWKLYNSSGTKTMFSVDSGLCNIPGPYLTFSDPPPAGKRSRALELKAPEPVGGIPPIKGDQRTTSGTATCNLNNGITNSLDFVCVYTQDYDEGNSLLIGVCTITVKQLGDFNYGFEFIPPPHI